MEPPAKHADVALEAAYYLVRYRHDAFEARAWLARGEGAAALAIMRPRAEAAVALAEHRPADALISAEAGLVEVARQSSLPNGSYVETEAEELRELASLARAALATPSA
jgi:hypothetical protein